MTPDTPPAFDALVFITEEVESWAGVKLSQGRYGGLELTLGTREFGILHEDGQVYLPLTPALKQALLSEGRALPHPLQPNSSWVSFHIKGKGDVHQALWLLRLSYHHKLIRLYLQDPSTCVAELQAARVLLEGLNLSPSLHEAFTELLESSAAP
jgi:hypothetical protein